MSREKLREVLIKYLPLSAVDICAQWIVQKNIHLKITRGRASKFGDYKPLSPGQGHHISVNHDLNPYAFLITFIHEVAHLHAFIKFTYFHEPHGKEWKNEFRFLLKDFIYKGVFPEDIKAALNNYIVNPAATSCSDHELMRALKKYNQKKDVLHLEELPDESCFTISQSRKEQIFRKGQLVRKRFQCLEINSGKLYMVSPLAEVVPMDI